MTSAHDIRRVLVLLLVLLGLAGAADDALAGRSRKKARAPSGPTYASALLIDAETGQILYEKSPHAPRTPASLAKMMLELIALEAIREGRIGLHDTVTVPEEVKKVRGTRLRLRPGETISVRDLLYATVISSANDAATALAVHLAGSVEDCVELMNRRAAELGMVSTRYENVHGLDRGGEPGNVTTAWDQAALARKLVTMPEALEINGTIETTIRSNRRIHTTNRLLGRCNGVDGLKTGYTRRAGYCLVSTAERDDMRLIGVVLGARSNRRRFSESEQLLAKASSEWRRVRVVSKGDDLGEDLAVRLGMSDSVRLVSGSDLSLLVPAARTAEIRVAVAAPTSTRAPVAEGWTLGRVQVFLGDSVAAEGPAVAASTVPRRNVLDRFLDIFTP